MDDDLLRRARAVAAREGKRLNEVFEEALAAYLQRKVGRREESVVARTAGILRLSSKRLHRILRDEPGVLGE